MHVKSLVGLAGIVIFTGLAASACGDSDGSKFGNGSADDGGDMSFPEGGFGGNSEGGSAFDGGNPYANDPPPTYCILDGGPAPPPVTGTMDCPSDKNLPGCPCTNVGQTAACWTGLRKNRNLGDCKDGMTTCEKHGELNLAWGDCTGETLPQMGATKGKAACECFSAGQWALANTSPCFEMSGSDDYAVSTVDTGGTAMCPTFGATVPPPPPSSDWSTDTLQVDCEGHFKLCYEIKAGDFAAPSASDCSVSGKVCVEADYLTANAVQPFPNLNAWAGPDSACAAKFVASGGYGEMTVIGEDILCDKIDDGSGNPEVFNRVKYCPLSCNVANPDPTMCMGCQQGGSGSF